MARTLGPPNGSALWPRWCLGPADLEGVSEKINKRDELVYNVLYAAMFLLKCWKLFWKSTILNPVFRNFLGGHGRPDPPNGLALRPRWCLGPAGLEGVSEKMDKRDELSSVQCIICSNISSNMLKIALKKHQPYFQKFSGGLRHTCRIFLWRREPTFSQVMSNDPHTPKHTCRKIRIWGSWLLLS